MMVLIVRRLMIMISNVFDISSNNNICIVGGNLTKQARDLLGSLASGGVSAQTGPVEVPCSGLRSLPVCRAHRCGQG